MASGCSGTAYRSLTAKRSVDNIAAYLAPYVAFYATLGGGDPLVGPPMDFMPAKDRPWTSKIDGGSIMNRRIFSQTFLAAAIGSLAVAAGKLTVQIGHTGLTWIPLGGGPGPRPAVDPMV